MGLNAAVAGTVILVGKLWDGVNDPLVGMISDRLHTRWGRRRPFLLFGALPFGFTFFLIFYSPPIKSTLGLALYYGSTYLLFDTLYTIINVPYAALTPELTEDYDERSSLAGWRMGVSILASLVTATAFKLLAEQVFGPWLGNIRLGYALVAAVWGFMLALPPILLFFVIQEPEHVPVSGGLQLWETFREVFQNRPFRLAATIYLLTFTTVDVVLSVVVWFLLYNVAVDPGFDTVILGAIMTIALVTTPLVVKLTQKFGKREVYIVMMIFWGLVMVCISLVPAGGQYVLLIIALLSGLGYGAAGIVPWAIVADVVEVDELHTGKRREGAYAGYLVLFRKLTSALAAFFVGITLSYTGFVAGTNGEAELFEQPASALLAIRLLMGALPMVMLSAAIWVAWQYPLTREAHEAIRRELARRRAEATTAD